MVYTKMWNGSLFQLRSTHLIGTALSAYNFHAGKCSGHACEELVLGARLCKCKVSKYIFDS